MKKPVLLLDVDGVLNVIDRSGFCLKRRITLMVTIRGELFPHRFYPKPLALPFMRWAWRHFDVHWLTAWRETANSIADWAELPQVPALVEDPKKMKRLYDRAKRARDVPKAWAAIDWKLEAVKDWFSRSERTILWIEDGISEEAHRWIDKRPNAQYFGTDSFVGVTRQHIAEMAKFAGIEKERLR